MNAHCHHHDDGPPPVAVLEDYTRGDGWDESAGVDRCPACGKVYSANGGYTGAVVDAEGTRYSDVLAADPEDAPFFCVGCWAILEANRKRETHRTLDEWDARIEE